MNNCRTRGLVLCTSDHSESDKIVTLYSPDLGKATGIAKGAKRSKKRFVNKLEIFSLLQIHYKPPRRDGLLFLSEAELEDAFLSLRTTYPLYVAAVFIGELTLRFTREHDPDPFIFTLLLWALQRLDKGQNPLTTCALFHLRLLGAAGYQPILDRCGNCEKEVRAGKKYSLHTGDGSLVCSSCQATIQGGKLAVTVQTLKFLHHAQHVELTALDRLRLSNKNVEEALQALHTYTLHLLQHEIHSWQQIRSMINMSKK